MTAPDLSYLDLRQGPNDAPHKPVLLLTLMRAMELGLVSENKFPISDELIGLFYSYWKELVRSNHTAKFHLPFYHLSNDGSRIWRIQKLPGFDENALTSSNSIKSLGTLRQYVSYGQLRDEVFLQWMDPMQRELARKQLLTRFFPLPVEQDPAEERS
ncbi:MAG: hypothetical protein JNM91_03970, partial [Flavobacteriales bacterium]|nr:hypothetical protein [Flavobacteriales bacterium]